MCFWHALILRGVQSCGMSRRHCRKAALPGGRAVQAASLALPLTLHSKGGRKGGLSPDPSHVCHDVSCPACRRGGVPQPGRKGARSLHEGCHAARAEAEGS